MRHFPSSAYAIVCCLEAEPVSHLVLLDQIIQEQKMGSTPSPHYSTGKYRLRCFFHQNVRNSDPGAIPDIDCRLALAEATQQRRWKPQDTMAAAVHDRMGVRDYEVHPGKGVYPVKAVHSSKVP